MPSSLAARASSTSRELVKLKYVASQLLKRTGLGLSR